MGILPTKVRVPDRETRPVKIPYHNLAKVASHDDGMNLNFTYEIRSDANGTNVYTKKREGIAILSSLGSADTQLGRGITSWRKSSGTVDQLIFALDSGATTTLYVDSSGTTTTTTKTVTTGRQVYFVPGSFFDGSTTVENLYVFTGADQVLQWTGAGITTGWSATTATPLASAQYGAFYRNMLVAAGTTGNKNRVFFSDVGKPDTFTAGNSLDFPGEITWLQVYEGSLMVFTRNNIYQLIGSQPNEIVNSSSARGLIQKGVPVGTDSGRSIARVGDWLYFWNRDRVYRYDTVNLQEVAYADFQKTFSSVVKTVSSGFAGIEFNGKYYLSLTYSSGTVSNAVAVYDPRKPIDTWVLHQSPWAHSFTRYRSSTDATPTLVFDTNSSTSRKEKVYIYNGSTVPLDNTSASTTVVITYQYTSQFLDFGDSHYIKRPKYIFFRTKGFSSAATATLKVAQDGGGFSTVLNLLMDAGGFVLDSSILDTDSLTDGNYTLTDVKRVSLPSCRSMAIQLYETQQSGQSEFYDFDLQIIPKKLKTK